MRSSANVPYIVGNVAYTTWCPCPCHYAMNNVNYCTCCCRTPIFTAAPNNNVTGIDFMEKINELAQRIEATDKAHISNHDMLIQCQLGIEKLHERIDALAKETHRPYRCPICEGYGFPNGIICNPCAGRGIVWS